MEIGWGCGTGSFSRFDWCFPICGDGRRLGFELCDDGNLYNGDGCDCDCFEERYYTCVGGDQYNFDVCTEICGDCYNLDPTGRP